MMQARRNVYIAGPMRGLPNLNHEAFDVAAQKAASLGFNPFSPASSDRLQGITPLAWKNTPQQIRDCVRRDTGALQSFRSEDGDAIALLSGWQNSVGAVAEVALARWLQLAILDAQTFEPYEPESLFEAQLLGLPIGLSAVA